MKNYWELKPSEVQVRIKDQKHLDELFEMCTSFGVEINISDYKSGYKYFRKNLTDSWYSNYIFNVDYTKVTTEQFYEILSHNYGYQRELKGFDKEVVLRMLECQVEQGKKRDIKVFEKNSEYSDRAGGFDWDETNEGADFWDETITKNKGKFTKQQTTTAASQDLEKNYEVLYNELLEKFNQLKKIINK